MFESDIVVTLFSWLLGMIVVTLHHSAKTLQGNGLFNKMIK